MEIDNFIRKKLFYYTITKNLRINVMNLACLEIISGLGFDFKFLNFKMLRLR